MQDDYKISSEDNKDINDSSSSSDLSKSEEEKIPEPMFRHQDSKTNIIVLMKAQTWSRESHGLYDYESRHVHKLEAKTEHEGLMVRDNDNVSFYQEYVDMDQTEDTKLFNLKKKPASNGDYEKFYISPINDNQPNDRLWLVIRSLKEGYKIKRHDILKLGRMKFKVKEFRTENEYFEGEHMEKSPHQGFEELLEVQQADDEETPCRICYISDQSDDNPIIGSCKCAGSIRYIHFRCLKMWMESKVNRKNETECHSTLNWKNFECELCKLAYPYTFILKGKRWNLVDLKRPEDKDTPYIILESLNSEKNSSRTIHTVIINTDKSEFTLGRGHDSDLRVNDISVSRKHATLEYRDGCFYFNDLKSKFGTLALLSEDVELVEHASKTFQIGRTVITLKAKLTQPWKNKTVTEAMFKDHSVKEKFMQSKLGAKNNQVNSPTSIQGDDYDQIQNPVPAFQTNQSKRVIESVENRGDHQQIIQIDGKRYLVIQELDPSEEPEN